MDINSILQVILNYMAITYPNLTTTQTTTDITGFVTNDNITWSFIFINGSTNGSEIIFTEQIRPLWYTVAVDDDINGFGNGVKRVIYKRDSTNLPYILVQKGKDGEWIAQVLENIRSDYQCFYDLSSLYCFGPEQVGVNRMKVSRIYFCDGDEPCVQKSSAFSYQASEKVVQVIEYNPCQMTVKYKDEKNNIQTRNLYNLQIGTVDVQSNDSRMCYNYSTFNLSPFSTVNLTTSKDLSFLLQYRLRQPYIPPCIPTTVSNSYQSCLDENESNKTQFQFLFYSILPVFAIYLIVNIVFLSYMFYRRRKMIRSLSESLDALKEIEKAEAERSLEKRQTTAATSNKETENQSEENTMMRTARQPRIFMNESMITADLPSSRKQMEESTGNNDTA